MTTFWKRLPHATAIALSAFPLAASAVDGVLEINHACAANGGCFSGDTADYPVEIQASGSYRLTGNLRVPDSDTDGIVVSANDVSIDLNGFAVLGASCSAPSVDCTPASGAGRGVQAIAPGVSVRNGSVIGMGSDGVAVAEESEVVGVRARWNGGHGIAARGARIVDNVVQENAGNGVDLGWGNSLVSGNTISGNDGSGIAGTNYGSVLSANTVAGNGADGIHSFGESTITGNVLTDNAGVGIGAGQGSTVSGNTVTRQGGNGIETTAGATVQQNTVFNNAGTGLSLSAESVYRDNQIHLNGTTVMGGVDAGGNVCNGSITCP